VRAEDAPKPGAYIYLVTLDGDVMAVEFLGVGGVRAFEDKGQHPWVRARESVSMYGIDERFRTGWDRLYRQKPRKQTSQ